MLKTKTYIITSAQNNTSIHKPFLKSLELYAKYNQAELVVLPIFYKKKTLSWFARCIRKYLRPVQDQNTRLQERLVLVESLRISPAIQNPFTGFKNYSSDDSLIIPSSKQNLASLPTMKFELPKFLYSTGTITLKNYHSAPKKSLHEEHHTIGALVVQTSPKGFWVRQIQTNYKGEFYDLSKKYTPEGVSSSEVDIIVHGDIHHSNMSSSVFRTIFSDKGVLDSLTPKYQIFHDTIDFSSRSHHSDKDYYHRSKLRETNRDSIQDEYRAFAKDFRYFRKDSEVIFVSGNHDQHILRFLDNPLGFQDPVNQKFWLKWNYQRHLKGKSDVHQDILKEELLRELMSLSKLTFISNDQSWKRHGIEYGMHGDRGAHGARGSLTGLSSLKRAVIGHSHTAQKLGDMFSVGSYSNLDMGYNKGLSAWSHTFLITYKSGRSSLITIQAGKPWL